MEILGLYFEDFPIGKSGGSVGKTITLADIQLFKEMSDWPDYSIDGKILVPEMLVTMVSAGFMTRQNIYEGTLLGISRNYWQYKVTVLAGDTLKMKYTVKEARLSKSGKAGAILFKIQTYNQRNETVAEGEMTATMRTRGKL